VFYESFHDCLKQQ